MRTASATSPRGAAAAIEQPNTELPPSVRQLIGRLLDHLQQLDRQAAELSAEIERWHRHNAASQKLAKIPGIGALTASALVAAIGHPGNFKNGRPLSAWLGLVPRQHSSGGKTTLLGISKRGDTYLRTLLIHGARAVIRAAQRHARTHPQAPTDPWLMNLLSKRNKNVAAVALANKNARRIWALLAHDREFLPQPPRRQAA